MKKFLFSFLLFTTLLNGAISQNISGYWYGTANPRSSGASNNYLIEMIINQDGRGKVKGILNYYFQNNFRSMKVEGTYNWNTRRIQIPGIPLPFHGSLVNKNVDCLMTFDALLKTARAGSDLTGVFSAGPDYKYTCGEMNVSLKFNASISQQDSLLAEIRNYKETRQVWTPAADDTLVAVNIIPRKVENYVVNAEYKKRENIVSREIEVESDSLKIDFYDNGEVDGDSISVFYNEKLIAFNRILSIKAIHIDLVLDSMKTVNEITMFADNLGRIPPNTALMLINDGKNRYELRLTSNLEKNATIRIKRKNSGNLKIKQ